MKNQTPKLEYKSFAKLVRRLAYLVVVILVLCFLYRLGPGPWVVAFENWRILLLMVLVAVFGIGIQAMSFNSICSVNNYGVSLTRLIAIWAVSAVVSLIAPIFAGITARTAALVKSGVPWRDCLGASFMQVALGIETALITGSISFLFLDWQYSTIVACLLFSTWLFVCVLSLILKSTRFKNMKFNKMARLVELLQFEKKPFMYFWFFMQIASMSAIYFIGFNGMEGEVSIAESVSLASVTVLISILVFLPNGLGVLDLFWVFLAQKNNFTLEEGVAVAILFRLSNFLAALLIVSLAPLAQLQKGKS